MWQSGRTFACQAMRNIGIPFGVTRGSSRTTDSSTEILRGHGLRVGRLSGLGQQKWQARPWLVNGKKGARLLGLGLNMSGKIQVIKAGRALEGSQ